MSQINVYIDLTAAQNCGRISKSGGSVKRTLKIQKIKRAKNETS